MIAAAILLGLGSHTSHAGEIAADAFDMGWCLGVASYQAAVGQIGLANDAIGNCQREANSLTSAGVLSGTNIFANIQSFPDMHAGLVSWREQYASELLRNSDHAGNAYKLGLLIGLAEGQCASPVFNEPNGAWRYAHDAIRQVADLIRSSSLGTLVGFKLPPISDAFLYTDSFQRDRQTAYEKVVALKVSYRNVVLLSDY